MRSPAYSLTLGFKGCGSRSSLDTDELGRYPDRVSVIVPAAPSVERIVELELGPPEVVEADEQDGLSHHRRYGALVLLWQAID